LGNWDHFKSQKRVLLIGKRPKMMRTNSLYDFEMKKISWFEPIRWQQTLWPFWYGHLGIYWEDSPWQKPSIWTFFCSAMIYVCFKRKKNECIMVFRNSTGIWSWSILTILTKITIFGHRFLSNQAFIKYNRMRFGKPYTWCSNKLLTLDTSPL
jgi:hypothetical protein